MEATVADTAELAGLVEAGSKSEMFCMPGDSEEPTDEAATPLRMSET